MNKVLLGLCLISSIAIAGNNMPFEDNIKGINYVSFKDSNLPENIKLGIYLSQNDMKKNGYVNAENSYVDFLLKTLPRKAALEIKAYKLNQNPLDSHLKENYKEIKLAIPYKPVLFLNKENIIGFAAVNTYSQVKNKEGWEGIIEFFKYPNVGTCAYEYDKITGVVLNKEFTVFTINNKPTQTFIEGTIKTGFLYSLNWYTDNYSYSLRCANMNFDNSIMKNMIEMSKRIDNGR